MASNGHHVAGFEFIDPGMGELAEKEFKAIQVINQRINKRDISSILKLYNQAIKQEMFQTFIGFQYLSELRDYMLSSGKVDESEILDIPVKAVVNVTNTTVVAKNETEDLNKAGIDTDNNNLRLLKRTKANEKKYKKLFKITLISSAVLLIIVIAMFIIAGTSDSPTIINYETVLLDKYSSWEQELSEKEAELNQREELLNQESNQRLNDIMSQAAEDYLAEEEVDTDLDGEGSSSLE